MKRSDMNLVRGMEMIYLDREADLTKPELSCICARFYKIAEKAGVCHGLKEGNSTRVSNPEWTALRESFLNAVRSQLQMELFWLDFKVPEELEAYDDVVHSDVYPGK